MAYIREVPPSRRVLRPRWRVYHEVDGAEVKVGTYDTRRQAERERDRINRYGLDAVLGTPATDATSTPAAPATEPPHKSKTPFGDYVVERWWPVWAAAHQETAANTLYRLNRRILPVFSQIPLGELDADTIGRWRADLLTEGLKPQTINGYLNSLGLILNAAVDSDYLDRSPLRRKSGAGRVAAAKNLPVEKREVWLSREPRAISDPSRTGRGHEKAPKTRAGRREIALDQETVDALTAHHKLVSGDDGDLIFTTSGGSRGAGGMVASNNFARVWKRALKDAKLTGQWSEFGGLHFHDLRHTHATWLIARLIPPIAVAKRLGHASPVVTMTVYAHVTELVQAGSLTTDDLGLEGDAT